MSKIRPEKAPESKNIKIDESTYQDEWKLYNPFAKTIQRKSQFLCCKRGHWGWTKTEKRNGYHIRFFGYWRLLYLFLILLFGFILVQQFELIKEIPDLLTDLKIEILKDEIAKYSTIGIGGLLFIIYINFEIRFCFYKHLNLKSVYYYDILHKCTHKDGKSVCGKVICVVKRKKISREDDYPDSIPNSVGPSPHKTPNDNTFNAFKANVSAV